MSKAESCWTCRLRRKKCSREQPVCQTCASLAIGCHYSEARPEWMDGGEKQNDMTQRVKAEIRQGAEARRKRQYVQVLSIRSDPAPNAASLPSEDGGEPMIVTEPAAAPDHHMEECPGCADADPAETKRWEALATAWSQIGASTPTQGLDDCELDFTMMYLDHVFPFLFPFYRPGMLDGGRSWLLATLQRSKTLFHGAMSLSSYFLTVILSSGDICVHEVCSQHAWNKLWEHTDGAIRSMQEEMQTLSDQGSSATLLQRARIMGSVAHLLVFEIAMARTSGLEVHLSAALAMVETLFERFKIDGQPDIELVMRSLERPSWAALVTDRAAWNTDQAPFRFFLAVLLWADVISCTSTNQVPRLRDYHAHMVFNENSRHSSRYLIRIEHIVGCPGWALLTIAEATRLGLWKREAKSNGSFSFEELVIRGDRLHVNIQDGLKRLDSANSEPGLKDPRSTFYRYHRPEEVIQSDDQDAAAHVWAHAARIYLMVVVIGWQPEHEAIRDSVRLILQHLNKVLSPSFLRSLAWPFCVAGCLASADQEQNFRAVAAVSGSLKAFGTVGQAVRIMECVWERRGQLEVDWDLASCFSIFGSPVLLF